jgi:hypothetical protein
VGVLEYWGLFRDSFFVLLGSLAEGVRVIGFEWLVVVCSEGWFAVGRSCDVDGSEVEVVVGLACFHNCILNDYFTLQQLS